MGIFDKVRNAIGIDRMVNKVVGVAGPLTLDVATMDKWTERLLRHQSVGGIMDDFIKDVERRKDRLRRIKAKLTDPAVKERTPERAHSILSEHTPRLLGALDRLIAAQFINNAYLLEDQQEEFRDALTLYRDATQKSLAALREFLGPELTELDAGVRELEDSVIHLSASLEQAQFPIILQVKRKVEQYKASREKEGKLQQLRATLAAEAEQLETRRRKIAEKIAGYAERAQSSKFVELIKEEEQLLAQSDEVKLHAASEEQREQQLKPIQQRLAFLRKQMISDVTALNISEQRTFLEDTKDQLLLARRKLARANELLEELSYAAFRAQLVQLLAPINVRIEDATTIIEDEEEHVAPQ